MISIAEAISDLLFVRDTVVVPGLGAFVKKPVSAKVNPVANHFTRPTSNIEFDANLREDNDLVVSYMSEQNDIPEEEAKKLLAMFVSDCFNNMKDGKKLKLNGIGVLYYDGAHDLVFEEDHTVNYNSDAFGLCDFELEPVLRNKTKDEIKEEIERQQKDKNTPVTVDEKAVHEHDREEEKDGDDETRGHGWLWLLLGLLLLAGVGLGLHYFKVIDFGRWISTDQPTEYEPWKVVLPETKTWATEKVEPQVQESDTLVEPSVEVVQEPENDLISHEANIRIIAGCFSQEENAERLANSLKDKGYTNAFYELRGTKWYVSFGRYATDEEATVALREIRANTEYKAWILK